MIPTVIEANPNSFSPNVPGVYPGAIVVDPDGATSNVGFVVRRSPTVNQLLVLSYLTASLTASNVLWTAGTSGDGTLQVTVLDNAGNAIEGAEVEVTLLAGTALTGVTMSVGTIVYSSGLTTVNAMARGLTSAAGRVTLAIDGTASTALRYTVRVIGLPQAGAVQSLSPTVVSVAITLPA